MKIWKLSIRISLFVALTIAVAAILPLSTSGGIAPVGEGDEGEWRCTPEALQRTQAGECNHPEVCLELCVNAFPTGSFGCFPAGMDPLCDLH
jgi:hypothetical protein